MDGIVSLLKKYTLPELTPGYVREFHDAVRAAIADGKLTEEEIAELEKKREELQLSEEALSAVRQDLYIHAFTAATENEDISEDEWDELEKIQDYLGLEDKDIAKSKRNLYRMRIMSEIRKNNLPIIQSDGAILDESETAHWEEQVDVLKAEDKKTQDEIIGTRFNEAGWAKADTAILLITNKRLIIRGHAETIAVKLTQIVHSQFFVNGVLIHINHRSPRFLKYRVPGNHNIVGSILLHAIAHAQH